MMGKRSKFGALFQWRYLPSYTAQNLADSLSVERVDVVPRHLYRALVAFRHLRQDARTAAAKRWIEARR